MVNNITAKLGNSYLPLYVAATAIGFSVERIADALGVPIPEAYKITLFHYTWEDLQANKAVPTLLDELDEAEVSLNKADPSRARKIIPVVYNPSTQTFSDYPTTEADAPARESHVALIKDHLGGWTGYTFEDVKVNLLEVLAMTRVQMDAQATKYPRK